MPVSPTQAEIHFALLPAYTYVEPGEGFMIDLTITESGSEFNAYDAYVSYDPEHLTFIQMDPVTGQEGDLMTEACAARFHQFAIAPDSTSVGINHVLLCDGVSLTGPGVVYRLCFQARDMEVDTHLQLMSGTTFYDNGLFVNPIHTEDALIHISDTTIAVPESDLLLQQSLIVAPNPFNPRTVLSFTLDHSQPVTLRIFTMNGRLVRDLATEQLPEGRHSIIWDGRDDRSQMVASGCFLAILESAAGISKSRLTLIR